MDIEKLIERLKKSADFEDYPVVACFAAIIEKKYLREAATALATLQAEVEFWKYRCNESVSHASELDIALYDTETENEKLRAELEQVKRERGAAVEDLKRGRRYKCFCCAYAKSENPFICGDCWDRIGGSGDAWQWRGAGEEN